MIDIHSAFGNRSTMELRLQALDKLLARTILEMGYIITKNKPNTRRTRGLKDEKRK